MFLSGNRDEGQYFYVGGGFGGDVGLASWPDGSSAASPPDVPTIRQANEAGYYSTGRAGDTWSTGGNAEAGLRLGVARQRIRARRCRVGIVRHVPSRRSLRGRVVGQSPRGGAVRRVNFPVNLRVGRGGRR